MSDTARRPFLTHASGAPVTDNVNIQTAGPRGPALLQDVWLIEKLAISHVRSSQTPHAGQGVGCSRHLHRHTRHHPLHQD